MIVIPDVRLAVPGDATIRTTVAGIGELNPPAAAPRRRARPGVSTSTSQTRPSKNTQRVAPSWAT